MPISRYDERTILKNRTYQYVQSAIFKSRRVNVINQYSTPELKYPDPSELKDIDIVTRTWGVGIKYFNLAYEFYGSPEYWWILAWFNLKPLETEYRAGDTVLIPLPLEGILSAFDLL